MKNKKVEKKSAKKEKIEIFYTQEKASFIRRGIAFIIDLEVIEIMSIIAVFGLLILLSYISPKYENPITKIKKARKKGSSVVITTHPEISEKFFGKREKRAEDTVSIGEEFGWVREFIIAYIYFMLCFYFGGKTLGKRIMGLKVIKRDNSKLTLGDAFERTHGYAFSTSILLIGFFQMLWDKKGLTMHDKIADTTVVRRKKNIIKRKNRAEKVAL